MPNIIELFNTAEVNNYVRARTYPTMLGESLFPETRMNGLTFEDILGGNGTSVAASIHGFDTESEIASREGIQSVWRSLALIKRKIPMREELIIAIANPRTNTELANTLKLVWNDVDSMVNAVKTRVEAMRLEALMTGQITHTQNGAAITIPYGVPAGHKATLTTKWSDPAATPLEDLQGWVNTMAIEGVTITRALTSQQAAAALLKNASLRSAVFGVNSAKMLSMPELNNFLSSMALPTILVDNRTYREQNADGTYTSKNFVAANRIALLPEGSLGETKFGPTAEEIRLMSKGDIDSSIVGNIFAMVYDTEDPVTTWTKAVATSMPSFPRANEVFLAQVLA